MIGIISRRIWWTTVAKMCELINWCTRNSSLSLLVLEAKASSLSIEYKILYVDRLKQDGR